MTTKLFILGRPGSGKSTAANQIQALALERGCSSIHINDYAILNMLFENEKQSKKPRRFQPVGNGFDVLDLKLLDVVLRIVERQARSCIRSSKYDLVIVEFSRADYELDLRRFGVDFLQDAYFLFLNVDLDTCVERVKSRAQNPVSLNDCYLSEDMMRRHYHNDNRFYMSTGLAVDYALDMRQYRIIDNTIPILNFITEVSTFGEFILDRTLRYTDPAQVIPELFADTNHEVAKCKNNHKL